MAATVTLVGTVMAPVLPIEMEVAVGTAWSSDTVQVELALLLRMEGLHVRLVSCAGALAVSVNVWEPPLSVAVIWAV